MKQPTNNDTKTALLRAAERLFAEKGFGGVTVKEITAAAGARNDSALHYHFGGISALIKEVFAKRYRDIEQVRFARLTEFPADPKSVDIETVLQASIAPFMAACLQEDGRMYARFCVQLAADPRFQIADLINDIGMPSLDILRRLLIDRLRGIPSKILITRFRRAFVISFFLAADYARQIELRTAPPVEEATREAAVTLAAFLSAQPPKKTPLPSRKRASNRRSD
jgi:AcrR family transcriptional regulator